MSRDPSVPAARAGTPGGRHAAGLRRGAGRPGVAARPPVAARRAPGRECLVPVGVSSWPSGGCRSSRCRRGRTLDPRQRPGGGHRRGRPDDWWTVGRRARLGLAAKACRRAPSGRRSDDFRFDELTGPYEPLNGVAVRRPEGPRARRRPTRSSPRCRRRATTLAHGHARATAPRSRAAATMLSGRAASTAADRPRGAATTAATSTGGRSMPTGDQPDGGAAETLERWPDRFSLAGRAGAALVADRGPPASTWAACRPIAPPRLDAAPRPAVRRTPTTGSSSLSGSAVGHVLSLDDVDDHRLLRRGVAEAGAALEPTDDWTMFTVAGLGARPAPDLAGRGGAARRRAGRRRSRSGWTRTPISSGRSRSGSAAGPPTASGPSRRRRRVVDEGARPEPPPPYTLQAGHGRAGPLVPVHARGARRGVRFVQGRLLEVAARRNADAPRPADGVAAPDAGRGRRTRSRRGACRRPASGSRRGRARADDDRRARCCGCSAAGSRSLAVPSSGLRFDAVSPT